MQTLLMPEDIVLVWLRPTPFQSFLKEDLTDFSCPSARCSHGLPLRREHPGLPQDLVKSKDKNIMCIEIFAGGKGGTTDNGQGSGFSVGNSVRRYIFAW